MKASVYRRANFNAAHRLSNPQWDDEKNKAVFGPCANPNYHGHNYDLEVQLTGDIDPETGFVIDLSLLKAVIKREVLDRLDHKNLNLDVPQFKDLNPTVENIAKVIYELLIAALPEKFDLKVRLYETKRNFVDYPAQR